MGIDPADLWYYALAAAIFTAIVFVTIALVGPTMNEEHRDEATSTMIGVLIALAVVFLGLIRNRRNAKIERMVEALYDHFGLGGDQAGGRCDKCGRGGGGVPRGVGSDGTDGEKEGRGGV